MGLGVSVLFHKFVIMYTTYHFKSASEINIDVVDAIKAAFKGRPVVITVDEDLDETSFLLSDPANRAMLMHSIAQDKNGESVTVTIPGA